MRNICISVWQERGKSRDHTLWTLSMVAVGLLCRTHHVVEGVHDDAPPVDVLQHDGQAGARPRQHNTRPVWKALRHPPGDRGRQTIHITERRCGLASMSESVTSLSSRLHSPASPRPHLGGSEPASMSPLSWGRGGEGVVNLKGAGPDLRHARGRGGAGRDLVRFIVGCGVLLQ